jgi:hypothetical protein
MTLRLGALSASWWTGLSGMLEGLRPNGVWCWCCWVAAGSLSKVSEGEELVGEPGGVGLTRGEETGVGGGEFFSGIEAGACSLPAQRVVARKALTKSG